MGNTSSALSWQNPGATALFSFLVQLWGSPSLFVSAAGGAAGWQMTDLISKTLFGTNVCFQRVVLRDEAIPDAQPVTHNDCLYLVVKAPVAAQTACNFLSITSSCGYDLMKTELWVRCDSLDTGIAALKVLTDYVVQSLPLDSQGDTYNTTVQSVYDATDTSKVDLVKSLYTALCSNLAQMIATPTATVERYADNPWSNTDWPYYVTNNPGNIALGEAEEDLFYRRLQQKQVAFPGVKPGTKEHFVLLNPNAHLAKFERMCDYSGDPTWCKKANFKRIGNVVNKALVYYGMPYAAQPSNVYNPFEPVQMASTGEMERLVLLNPDAHLARLQLPPTPRLEDFSQPPGVRTRKFKPKYTEGLTANAPGAIYNTLTAGRYPHKRGSIRPLKKKNI